MYYNFPEQAQVSGKWYIDSGWSWWWRASRVIEDIDLSGNHIEIIDEFPIFSYVLSDNHPHLLAMPFVLLVVAIALNWFSADGRDRGETPAARTQVTGEERGTDRLHVLGRQQYAQAPVGDFHGRSARVGFSWLWLRPAALLFLNTWDFPPYWLLLVLVAMLTRRRAGRGCSRSVRCVRALSRGAIVGVTDCAGGPTAVSALLSDCAESGGRHFG